MEQINRLKRRLLLDDNEYDELLSDLLEDAGDIICEIRNSDAVEKQYLNIQVKIAVELFNKLGAEGQVAHTENGISRSYESADISNSLLKQITPMVRGVGGSVRVVE